MRRARVTDNEREVVKVGLERVISVDDEGVAAGGTGCLLILVDGLTPVEAEDLLVYVIADAVQTEHAKVLVILRLAEGERASIGGGIRVRGAKYGHVITLVGTSLNLKQEKKQRVRG